VLIQGETGTGKELIARAVHAKSGRSDRPLVTVNCSALPAELIESELFGHEKGSFTGAVARQIGRFELADGGTIFLDEIGELPLNLQIKLLRVLQEGEFERIGSASTIKVNVRVIAATNRNLSEAIHNGSFRADLYYRLNVYPISLPPLRDRKQDIVRLATAFLREASAKLGKRFDRLPAAVVMVLESYDWPGNVRELQNAIERAAVISAGDTLQLPEDWQPSVVERHSTPAPSLDSLPSSDRDKVERVTLEDLERRHILRVLGETGWKVEGPRGAATILGLPPNTLRSRMKKLGIPTKRSQQKAEVPSRLRTH
jgi:transcriptional regulator with GAF, ATPase, and Fis domain